MPHWYNKTWRGLNRYPFLTAVITILIIVVPGIYLIGAKTKCATDYAHANFERTRVVSEAQNVWINTLDSLVLHPPPGGQKVALAEFKAAAIHFNAVRAANPIEDTKPAHC